MRALADIDDDDPITLAEASRVVLHGAVTVSALRAEVLRGNLTVERIGKNLFTTRAAIREMREKCRVKPSRQGSISEKTKAAEPGSSGTMDATDELAVLQAIGRGLKDGSLTTSLRNTPRGRQGAASPIPFPSRKS